MKAALLLAATLSKWVYTRTGIDLPPNVDQLVNHERYVIVKPKSIYDKDEIKEDGRTCVIVHRGTDSIDDLEHDIESQFDHGCTKDGYVRAFADSLNEFKSDQKADMVKLKEEGTCRRYIMVGHSLGGATVAAWGKDPDVKHKITFGEPKTCCGSPQKDLNHWRVINGLLKEDHDPIPALPKRDNAYHCTSNVMQVKSGADIHASHIEDRSVPQDVPMLDMKWHAIGDYIVSIEASNSI